ncbi:CLUMA_CG006596, isoform A [Clunio marinus]|uniref:asparagine--tRNA ligase n=1 Tax=Clunio marinus TaxID=568069 RepID=A0A1J1I2J4_9DIPT|nr:CLUMA_CG006596, isoform A [Clunio marinus]
MIKLKTIFSRNYCTSSIKEVLTLNTIGQKVKTKGWVKNVRSMKEHLFADINDGSTGENLQIVCSKSDKERVGFGSSIEIKGVTGLTPKGKLEVITEELKLIGKCPLDGKYPYVARQTFAPEYIRENLHFRSRVSSFNAMIRCRHHLTNIINNYLYNNGFIQVNTPIITGNDCEGAGEIFMVKPESEDLLKSMKRNENEKSEDIFFDHKVFLTVSGQLHLESMAHGLSKVYTFGPTFRAENSKSPIHLSEFYMLELEQSFVTTLDDVIDTLTKMFKTVTNEFLEKSSNEVVIINKSNKEFKLESHFDWVEKEFPVMTFQEAFSLIDKNKDKFTKPPNILAGISKEQEHFLADYCQGPCFVIDWPKDQKSFYMRQKKENPEIVEAFDFIVPRIGEVAGGSVREDEFETLRAKIPNEEALNWYLDLRKYGGVTTGGFGLGFERYLQFLTNITSIKDVIPFPRWPHNCSM